MEESNKLNNLIKDITSKLNTIKNINGQLTLSSKLELKRHRKLIPQSQICLEYQASENPLIKVDAQCSTEDNNDNDLILQTSNRIIDKEILLNQNEIEKESMVGMKTNQSTRQSEGIWKLRLSNISESEKYVIYTKRLSEFRIQLVSDSEQINLLKNEIKDLYLKNKQFARSIPSYEEFKQLFLIALNNKFPKEKSRYEAYKTLLSHIENITSKKVNYYLCIDL